ncbi:hypothetical protein EHE19_006755 [Ruminiclostridium herbifermentans]|uniref:Uncharacterized protein n=2 Tax=Ruminiclostridium herbifermentans TaxID=2488810 RepID=A0A4U7JCT7_9FIRM|nr:hypothetical protein EHE19_006755 [Ruminiclostridium herbifermentans]
MLALAFILSLVPQTQVTAATNITDNYTQATAYNFGSWSYINSSGTAIMANDADESWFKFTVGAKEHIYLRVSSDRAYVGMSVQIKNGIGVNVGSSRSNPINIIDTTGVTPALYIDVDNDSSSTQTFYVVVSRGNSYQSAMYFSISAYDRIRTGSGTFSFSGTASNNGNSPYNANGVDSTILTLDLSNSSTIPNNAIVTNVSTSGTQSPSQGNVHHKIRPNSTTTWYTSTVSSATSGSYSISINNNFAAKQIWSFRYNALASAKSTMKNVKITLKWQYDLHDTGYQIFTN